MPDQEPIPEKSEVERTADLYRRSIGHYLKNSIAPIVGFAEILQLPNISEEKKVTYIKQIATAAADMDKQIEKLITTPVDNLTDSAAGPVLDIKTT